MSLFDIGLILIIVAFALAGAWLGFLHTLGSLIGTVLGIFFASRMYEGFAMWLMHATGWGENFCRIVAFIFVFIIINRLVGILFWALDKVFSIVTRLPVIGTINRFFGLIFGILEGVIVIGIVSFFIAKFPVSPWFMHSLATSKVAAFSIGVASILWPLLPSAVQSVKSTLVQFLSFP